MVSVPVPGRNILCISFPAVSSLHFNVTSHERSSGGVGAGAGTSGARFCACAGASGAPAWGCSQLPPSSCASPAAPDATAAAVRKKKRGKDDSLSIILQCFTGF